MKLLLVTFVEEYQKDVIRLFKKAHIESFSESDIDGYKTTTPNLSIFNWFSSVKLSAESRLFFSFTDEEKIQDLFSLIKIYNKNLETNNPIKAVVVPIEKFI